MNKLIKEQWQIKSYEFIGNTLISVKRLNEYVSKKDVNSLVVNLQKLENKIRRQRNKLLRSSII